MYRPKAFGTAIGAVTAVDGDRFRCAVSCGRRSLRSLSPSLSESGLTAECALLASKPSTNKEPHKVG